MAGQSSRRLRLVFQSDSADPARWREGLLAELPDLDFRVWPDTGDPHEVDAVLLWRIPADIVERFPNLKLIHLISAGVDQLDSNPAIPASVPVARLVEPGQVAGMVEYALHAVLHYHRDFHRYQAQQQLKIWREYPRISACDRSVGVMGLGALGGTAAQALAKLGFDVGGWARRPTAIDKVTIFAGAGQLPAFLARSEIVVSVLPLTLETRALLDARVFGMMRSGAYFINIGRGGLINEADLIAALNSGHLAGATLDVVQNEPPSPDDPIWSAPNLLLTPHIAASADPRSAAKIVAENLRRVLRGDLPLHPVRLHQRTLVE
jgi:glyoxylate/hydroxypyruvate reductase A